MQPGMGQPGMGHLIVGSVLLAAGIGVTVMSDEIVWYGAIVVGAIEIARGLYLKLVVGPPPEFCNARRP